MPHERLNLQGLFSRGTTLSRFILRNVAHASTWHIPVILHMPTQMFQHGFVDYAIRGAVRVTWMLGWQGCMLLSVKKSAVQVSGNVWLTSACTALRVLSSGARCFVLGLAGCGSIHQAFSVDDVMEMREVQSGNLKLLARKVRRARDGAPGICDSGRYAMERMANDLSLVTIAVDRSVSAKSPSRTVLPKFIPLECCVLGAGFRSVLLRWEGRGRK